MAILKSKVQKAGNLMTHGTDRSFGFEFIDVARKIQAKMNKRLMPIGMTFPQYRVLSKIWLEGEMTQKFISDELALAMSTLTPMIQLLARKGWIIRTTNELDSRSKRIRLTEEGIEILNVAKDAVYKYGQLELNVLSDDELCLMFKILRLLDTQVNVDESLDFEILK